MKNLLQDLWKGGGKSKGSRGKRMREGRRGQGRGEERVRREQKLRDR